ncbi:MAG: 1-phosphofructokinase family hexose kinase [Lachnospiraceae bacterium]
MIITVTLNSAIDKRGTVEHLDQGRVNRVINIVRTVGGKGINVSKKIKLLGGESIATGFTGGSGGVIIDRFFKENEIASDFVTVKGMTRTNLKIVERNGLVTEFNNPGPEILDEEMEQLVEKIDRYAEPENIFVFAGSVPENKEPELYTELIQRVVSKGCRVVFEGSEKTLKAGIAAKPSVIVTSRIALETLNKMEYHATEKDVVRMCTDIVESGIETIIVNLGSSGVLFVMRGEVIYSPRVAMDVYVDHGVTDAIVAGVAYTMANGNSKAKMIRRVMAMIAASCVPAGQKIDMENFQELMDAVEIIKK